jgi:DNA-binding NtrC family response regulator
MDSTIRILLADDNERVRSTFSGIISEADPDWEVCAEVANGQLAVEKAAELKPDLVVLDFSMPILDGISAGRKIRSMLPEVPVLLYTFVTSARIEQDARKAGINAVIEKADFRKLVQEMRALVRGIRAGHPDPIMRKRHVYRCLNSRCGAELHVERESAEQFQNPTCCCGAEMTRRYDAPAVKNVERSPEVVVLLKLLAELHGFALVDKTVALDRADTREAAPLERPRGAGGFWVPPAEDERPSPLPLEQVHDLYVQRVLESCGGNRAHAAQVLGIGRNTLYRTLKRLGLVRRNRKKGKGQAGDTAAPCRRADVHEEGYPT